MQNRTAIVTGGAGAIGKAATQALVEAGNTVVIADLDAKAGESAARETGAHFIQADLSDRGDCHALTDKTLERFGSIDILVNNAGVQHMASIEEFPEEKWDLIMDVTLTAPFLLTKYAFPSMKDRGWGRIVNIASIQGIIASTYKVAYVTAKTGMLGLTRTTALEGGPHGITANALCPAYVDTPLISNQIPDQARLHNIPEEEVPEKVFFQSTAVKRMIKPEEVASLIAYLCGDMAGAITGATWTIDLGFTAQ